MGAAAWRRYADEESRRGRRSYTALSILARWFKTRSATGFLAFGVTVNEIFAPIGLGSSFFGRET